MFKKWFNKYSLLLSGEENKKKLYKLFLLRNLSFIILLVFSIPILILSAFAEKANDKSAINLVFTIACFAYLILGAICLIFYFKFKKAYKKLLKGENICAEKPEVKQYREKVLNKENAEKKSSLKYLVALIIGIISLIGFFVWDAIANSEKEDITYISYIGIAIFAVCFAIFLVGKALASVKVNNENAPAQREIEAVSKAQGEKYEYDITQDKNLNSLKYLFPTKELYDRANELQNRQIKATLVSMVVSLIISAIVIVSLIIKANINGLLYPIFVFVIFSTIFFSSLPFSVKLKKLEKQQRKIVYESNGFELNKKLYALYDNFNKFKSKAIFIFCGLSFLCGLVLGIILIDKFYSAISVVFMLVGLFVNNKLVKNLRQSAIPIEKEIDDLKN